MVKRREKERRRGKRRENRHERRQQQHAGGGEWDVIRIPEGLAVFKPEKNETYHIDVLPYIVGGHNKAADPGDEYFELSYPVYRSLGIDAKKFIAIGELCGRRDPVAEHFARLRKQGANWDDIKIFKPTQRQLMLIFVHEQADKGLQLYEGAYGTFGELLDEEIKANEEDFIDNFDDPDHGATLVVRFKAKNIGQTNPWILASKINFEEREDGFDANGDKALASEILEKAESICLDELLKIPDYATLQKALDGEPLSGEDSEGKESAGHHTDKRGDRKVVVDEDDDEDDDPEDDDQDEEDDAEDEEDDQDEEPESKKKGKPEPKSQKSKAPTGADLGIVKGGSVEHDDYGMCTVMRVATDGLTITLMDEDDMIHKGIAVDDVEPVGNADDHGDKDSNSARGATAEPSTSKQVSAKPSSAGSSARSDKKKVKSKATDGKDDDWDDDWKD
jgi:hypothetical protein